MECVYMVILLVRFILVISRKLRLQRNLLLQVPVYMINTCILVTD